MKVVIPVAVFFYVLDVFLNQGLIKGDGVALVISQISNKQ